MVVSAHYSQHGSWPAAATSQPGPEGLLLHPKFEHFTAGNLVSIAECPWQKVHNCCAPYRARHSFGKAIQVSAFCALSSVLAEKIPRLLGGGGMKASAAATGAIFHRDLKPDNIMLVADSEVAGGERAKVLDFGLAKLLVLHQGVKTRTGSFFGTPTYMSPEQCGRKAPVGEKSDVYARVRRCLKCWRGDHRFLATSRISCWGNTCSRWRQRWMSRCQECRWWSLAWCGACSPSHQPSDRL